MRSMGDPRYEYRPISEEKREKMRAAQKKRLGIPNGHFVMFGRLFSERHREHLRPFLRYIYDKNGKAECSKMAQTFATVANAMDQDQRTRDSAANG